MGEMCPIQGEKEECAMCGALIRETAEWTGVERAGRGSAVRRLLARGSPTPGFPSSGGFPGSVVKESDYNARDPGSIPGSGRSPGEGNGNPLQYSCLENAMDGGVWWSTVHGVTKSQTRLSNLTFPQASAPTGSGCLKDPWAATLSMSGSRRDWTQNSGCRVIKRGLPTISLRHGVGRKRGEPQ